MTENNHCIRCNANVPLSTRRCPDCRADQFDDFAPWRLALHLVIPGRAQQRGSKTPQLVRRKGGEIVTTKNGRPLISTRDDNAKSKGYMESARATAFAAWKGRDLLDCPVAISAVFLFARVKGHYGTGRNAGVLKASAPAYHAQSPDLAKLVRTIEDALTGVVWRDDKQVCEYLPPFKREWTTGSECAEITVYELAK